MMGRQVCEQRQLFYEFNLDDMIPADHLLRRLNVLVAAALAICMVACGRSTATLIAHPSIQS